MTVLVSTHYMDEAERCHRLAYIAYGKLLVDGTADEVIAHSGLATWSVALHPPRRRAGACAARPGAARRAGRRHGRPVRHHAARFRAGRAGAGRRAGTRALARRILRAPHRDVARGRLHQPDAGQRPTMSAERSPAPGSRFSLARAFAISLKEFVQMRRDRLTFAMIVGIPILQLLLFGFAINTDPKALPTAVVDYDRSEFTRSIVPRAREHRLLLDRRDARRARTPPMRCSLAATSSSRSCSRRLLAATGARRTARRCCSPPTRPTRRRPATRSRRCRRRDAAGARARPAPVRSSQPAHRHRRRSMLNVQRRYNPEGVTQYNIVPGLIGVILHDDDGDDDGASP